jgi:putative transposon-encoded protein
MQSPIINKEDSSNKELMQSLVIKEEDNSNKELMQYLVINKEYNSIKELMHTFVIIKEKILNLNTNVIVSLEDICMELGNGKYIEVPKEALENIKYTTVCTLEELEKLQNKYMLLLQQLDQSNNHEEQEKNIQLEEKEEEINILKTKVVDLTK